MTGAGLCSTAEWGFNGATQKVSGDKSHAPAEAQHCGFLLSPPRAEKGLHHPQLLHLPGTPKAASPWEVSRCFVRNQPHPGFSVPWRFTVLGTAPLLAVQESSQELKVGSSLSLPTRLENRALLHIDRIETVF